MVLYFGRKPQEVVWCVVHCGFADNFEKENTQKITKLIALLVFTSRCVFETFSLLKECRTRHAAHELLDGALRLFDLSTELFSSFFLLLYCQFQGFNQLFVFRVKRPKGTRA